MLIKALCEYADFLDETGQEKVPDGWGYQDVSFRIMLNTDGEVINITDIREEITLAGKNKIVKVPSKLLLPERTQKTAID